MRRASLLFLLLALPGPLKAQAEPPPSQELRARSVASLLLKTSQIAGKGRSHLGGWVGLALGPRLALGGGGVTTLEAVELPGSGAGTGFNLRMGYGGLVIRAWWPLRGRLSAESGLLLGAGHAEVKDRLTAREVGSDNFVVAEPEGALTLSPLPWLHLGAGAGYRLIWGVQDLPSVEEGDLRSMTATVFLRLGGK